MQIMRRFENLKTGKKQKKLLLAVSLSLEGKQNQALKLLMFWYCFMKYL